MMSPLAKKEYLEMIYVRYQKAQNRKEKSRMIDEFCKSYGCHRKSAIRLLCGVAPSSKQVKRRGRKQSYSERIIRVIESVWEASGHPWSKRLSATLELWMPWMRERYGLSPGEEAQILKISPAQMDRRLKDRKRWIKRKVYGSTKAGKILKHQIPIQTECWNVRRPGFMESDLVSHCGGNASGLFANTLNWTDIYSEWTESRCLLGRSKEDVVVASDDMKKDLPFKLLGLDCDNDGSFINDLLFLYCRDQKIQFTRSRPYKKDDNAHIEQKNDTHVRQVLGYVRYDTIEAVNAMNDLYRNELHLYNNYFRPCVKLVKKVRIGSRIRKKYDDPRTPYQRLSQSKYADPARLAAFKTMAEAWDPFELVECIAEKLDKIYALASKTPQRWIAASRPKKNPPMPTPGVRQSTFPNEMYALIERLRQTYRKEKTLQTW